MDQTTSAQAYNVPGNHSKLNKYMLYVLAIIAVVFLFIAYTVFNRANTTVNRGTGIIDTIDNESDADLWLNGYNEDESPSPTVTVPVENPE